MTKIQKFLAALRSRARRGRGDARRVRVPPLLRRPPPRPPRPPEAGGEPVSATKYRVPRLPLCAWCGERLRGDVRSGRVVCWRDAWPGKPVIGWHGRCCEVDKALSTPMRTQPGCGMFAFTIDAECERVQKEVFAAIAARGPGRVVLRKHGAMSVSL